MDSQSYGFQGHPTANSPVWGLTMTHGNCLGFFTAYHKCYIQADIPERECQLWKDDYVECKTHRREKARLKRIHEEFKKKDL